MSLTGPTRSVGQLYRDCLRLVSHIGANSAKGKNLRLLVRGEFRKNADVTDPQVIDQLKGNATRALSNYLMLESVSQDKRLKEKSNIFIEAEREKAKEFKDEEGRQQEEVESKK